MSRTTKTAISGAVGIVAGFARSIAARWYLGRNDPPGRVVDRPLYVPPQALIVISLLVFLVATLFGIVRSTYRQISNRKNGRL